MTAAPRQLQVLRLLRAHRFMDAAQVQQVVFAPVTLRSCQRCLTTLHRKGLVVRVQPARGGWGSGSSGYIYGLSEQGAEVLGQHDDAPRERTPHVVDAERFSGQLAQHQLAVNRCFIALWQALEAAEGHALLRWNSDPHLRMRYRAGGGWQVIHPDGLAQVRSPAGEHWLFFEIDRGTKEIRRYELKVRRYVRFWRSGAWKSEFPVFPELRISTTHRARVARLRDAAEEGVRGFVELDSRAVSEALQIAVAWEPAYLSNPLGPVWEPAFGEGAIQQDLLRVTSTTRANRKETQPETSR